MNWLFRMAWRDSRKSLPKLLLFTSSIVLGITALVAVNTFSTNLQKDIDNQAKELLGADMEIHDNQPVPDSILQYFSENASASAKQYNFASMAAFPASNRSRLVDVRALFGRFPFYGELETQPAEAVEQFYQGKGVLIDKTVLLQMNAAVGDTVRLGNVSFEVLGTIEKAPGQNTLTAAAMPVVYFPGAYVEQTGLLQKGSRVNYRYFYKVAGDREDLDKEAEAFEERFEDEGVRTTTVNERKRRVGRTFQDLNRFLNLVGFVALLLGCVGVASAVHVYVKGKVEMVALLRCLGVSGKQSFQIFLIQVAGMGLVGALIGAILGSLLQLYLPVLFREFMVVEVTAELSWLAILQGVITGLVISVLFALLPLLAIRKISPLRTLRANVQENNDPDWFMRSMYLVIALFVFGFTYWQTNNWGIAAGFTGGVTVAFGILSLFAYGLMSGVRKYFPTSWSYLWRQSLANLFRPNNQTLVLIVTVGLGTMLIVTLFAVQGMLLNRVELSTSGKQPNMILFDIQDSQHQKVREMMAINQLPVIQDVPMVTLRLEKVNGMTKADVREDSTIHVRSRTFNREYRVTYRKELEESEKTVAGEWKGAWEKGEPIGISFSDGFARSSGIELGDTLTFNVQGARLETVVTHLREVDWSRMQANFVLIFPTGVLEKAPKFHIMSTKVPDKEVSAQLQSQVVSAFPNISMIDLDLILRTLDDVLDKVAFVIQFMALFSIVTGLLVLIGAVVISKYQRMHESVLLRTIGASRKQVLGINALEYFFLGVLAVLVGIILGYIATWAIGYWVFDMFILPDLLPALVVAIGIVAITVLIGVLNSREIVSKPPLAILRAEI
ncbi:FtsX-like permease family protein [Limibacter armeniacum]|uniref:ABC transporter permease n=1 Tax=Limibacter armeniacum TaxID=466084 RepID=UPI002FE632D1